MNVDEIELCRVYGQMSREYLGDVPWESCVERLEAGWYRLRRNPTLEWSDVAPLVRVFWNLTP